MEKFEIGDWVVANGENHTRDNINFPIDKIWKILNLKPEKSGGGYYVEVDADSTDISGRGTDTHSIRKATQEEINNYLGITETTNYEIY